MTKSNKRSFETVKNILAIAGISINGKNPWDMQVHNEDFYSRVLKSGSMGLGESYMDDWWDAEQLDEFFNKLLSAKIDRKIITPGVIFAILYSRIFNRQTQVKAKKDISHHYDIGNNFYAKMLDPLMCYSCAYWKDAQTLEQAQKNKLELICKKLQLKKGERLLEIGSGWGGFAKYAAENYGVLVTCYNISKEQILFSRNLFKGLPVEVIEKDYRFASGTFDKVVSIGMFEAVGYKNFGTFMQVVKRCLKDDGLFLLHTIGKDVEGTTIDPWINKYIFPGAMLPSLTQITKAIKGHFVMEDFHNFGAYYDPTLMAWYKNFNENWEFFRKTYGERFYRMWRYYLLSCAGLFRARRAHLWQIVLSPKGVPGGYTSIR